jgi:uncharacterized iron-regulated membrane protein
MAYRFTRTWAAVQVAVGFFCIGIGLLAGFAFAVWWPRELTAHFPPATDVAFRVLTGAIIALAGLVIGTPFVITGQLVQVQLATLRRLRRISRYLGRWERDRLDRDFDERRGRRG